MNLIDLAKQFSNEDDARNYLEGLLWPNGPVCPHCGVLNEATKLEPRKGSKAAVRKGVWKCNACRQQFTVTVKTIFEDSHIPLHKWMMTIHLMNASKKGISAHQIHRMLGIGYRAAWFMCHRVRHAMAETGPRPKMQGVVEVDETYVGGKVWGRGVKVGKENKTPVVSLVQRNGKARSFTVKSVNSHNLRKIVAENLHCRAKVMTDESPVYPPVLMGRVASHDTVNHRKDECSRVENGKLITTNSVEGFFSILKRGIVGTFHHVSKQHLDRYLSEFDFRYNAREVTDVERAELAVKSVVGKRLKYIS